MVPPQAVSLLGSTTMKKMIWAALAAAGAALALGGAVAWAQSLPLPPGAWRATCGEARAYVQGGGKVLSARCTRRGGGTVASTLRYDTCRGQIINDNGRLACSGGGGGGGSGPAIPRGSYRDSCNGVYMSGWNLNASCRDSSGRWNRTSLDIRTCGDRDIANLNGRLSCTGGIGGGGQLPAGSYRSSCNSAYMTGWTLNATCRDNRGRYVRTTLDIRPCDRRDIANVDGRLVCNAGGGGGASRITLCTQPDFGGRCETIDRAAPSLGRWEIADRARSARVRGRWQVCSEPDFRGQCRTLDRDVRNLERTGLGRRISSVRPVR
jgi:hypothetical protein